MTNARQPSPPAQRSIDRICQPTHPAVIAWLGWQQLAARTERLLGAVLLAIGAAEDVMQQEFVERLGLTARAMADLGGGTRGKVEVTNA